MKTPADVNILVVDDESSITVLCQHLLELSSYHVYTASEPADALRILESQKVDLLLTDIRLPEIDGFELAQNARALQPEIAVVVMTGYRTVETAIRALRSGVDGLVIKPYELGPELQDVVRQALENSHKKQSATSLAALQPLFHLSNASLVDYPPAAMQALVLESLREMLGPSETGMYTWSAKNGAFLPLLGGEGLPGPDDPFWKSTPLLKMYTGESLTRLLVVPQAQAETNNLLSERNWSSLLLVALRRRKEQVLFVAARSAGTPAFLRVDLDLLTAFARQAVASLENARLFHRLAGFARQVEDNGGLLVDAERMTLLQTLMPALIHEVNNPLQAVKNNMYLAGRGGQPADRIQGYLSTAQKELYRLEVILQRILALTQPVCADRASVDPEQIVAHVLDLFQLRIKDQNIQVRLSAARPTRVVSAVRDQLVVVLESLVENAVQTLAGQEGEKWIWIEISNTDDQVRIAVEDSGLGLAEGVEANLFKPFFTTRPGGTGLGLAVSQRLVEAQGGKIAPVPGRHGQGLCIQIDLPAAASS